MSSILIRPLQEAVTTRLNGLCDFDGVAVLTRIERSIANDVAAALNRTGLCIEVLPPLILTVRPNSNGIFSDDGIRLTVRAVECPPLNKSTQDAATLAELLLYHLHLWNPSVSGLGTLHAADNCLEPVDMPDHLVAYDIHFSLSGGFAVRSS